VNLQALAIQAEAWIQEEVAAQRGLQAVLAGIEAAARAGTELSARSAELEAALASAAARDARRRALLSRVGSALGIPARAVTLGKLAAALEQTALDGARLSALRAELRAVVAGTVRASRRLSALARYHRGLLEELAGLITGGGKPESGVLVDAEG
jgi:hypothetical protein